jgi:hypothetical protein
MILLHRQLGELVGEKDTDGAPLLVEGHDGREGVASLALHRLDHLLQASDLLVGDA